jgi:hypothetical protein
MIKMQKEEPSKFGKFSRRGLLRGDWFKVIRDRGALQLQDHQKIDQVDFRIQQPEGNIARGTPDLDEVE